MDVRDLWLSNHKDLHPEDSDNPADIGLSSEEEADNLDEHPAIRRKYHQTSQPTVTTASTTGGSTSTVTTATTTSSTSTDPQMTTIQIPVTALQQVHSMLGQMLQGQVPDLPQQAPVPPAPLEPAEDMPFSVTRPKRGEKQCTVCQRNFGSTDTLRRHIKSHTGKQQHIYPNPGCGRKLSSKRSYDTHLTTCQKEKTKFCKKAGCNKLFATKAALQAHQATHITLKKDAQKCKGCGKEGFTRQKSLDDHYWYCDGNPDRVGPFPCPVAGCRRGKDRPFRHTQNLNLHLKEEHGYNPKHTT